MNVGCGDDYREGYINIDGSDALRRIDKCINLPKEKLSEYFQENSVDYILCNDFLEHHFHFEAIEILRDFRFILKPRGVVDIRVPDAKYIISNPFFSIEKKMILLFGGQDLPQGNMEMDKSRKEYPYFFCHKYGWTKKRMVHELISLGMKVSNVKRVGSNILIKGIK